MVCSLIVTPLHGVCMQYLILFQMFRGQVCDKSEQKDKQFRHL
ncbi:MAG: hypothetical protein ACJAXU_001975, partial [Paracoccaceae bacterium]